MIPTAGTAPLLSVAVLPAGISVLQSVRGQGESVNGSSRLTETQLWSHKAG